MSLFVLADLERGPGRRLLRITQAMGFSEAVARAGLEAEFDAWMAPGATDRVLEELEGVDLARRPETVLVLGAATLPVSTLRAVLMARLLGARVLLKPATGQEGLASILAEADARVLPTCFRSDDTPALQRAMGEAHAVVVLGGDETLSAVASRLGPEQAFVGYGHRVSAAHLAGAQEADLQGLAADLLAWDGRGCLSPQVVWTDGDLEATAQALAAALAQIEAGLPFEPGPGLAHARYVARCLGAAKGQIVESATAVMIIGDDPAFVPSPGGRVIHVLPDHGEPWDALGEGLSSLGCSKASTARPRHASVRRCALGSLQRPPLDWPHDGRPNLRPMLRTQTLALTPE
jgi:hypothetical protein